jgi:hypothetical protein
MEAVHEGGCLCGAVRYRVTGEPVRASACHCTNCQRRTGSAFGIGTYFKEAQVSFNGAPRGTYEYRSDESGRWLRNEFCVKCGTTMTWTAEALPGVRAIAGGSYDDPKWFRLPRHAWLRSALPWFTPPAGTDHLQHGSLPPPTK